MLPIFRPFKVGQLIIINSAGHSGTVKNIDLFTTELATPDNVQIIIPNSQIWSSSITNFFAHETRRVDCVFGVAYGPNPAEAERIIQENIDADERIHTDPAPFVAVTNLGDSSVDFTTRVWCNAGNYWGIKFDLTRGVKEAFDTGGIDIPFPTQRVIH